MTTSNETPAPIPVKKRRRGLWWKILLLIIVILLILLLLAPTLLSTSAGKNFILGEVNKSISGKLTAQSISLGWFSPASINQLEMTDAQGKSVFHFDQVATGVTCWDALAGSTIDLKKCNVAGGKMPELPGVTVSVNLAGTADLGKKVINFTGDSTVSAVDDKDAKRTVLTLHSGSKASWGDQPMDVQATLEYNWDEVAKIIQASLPEGTIMAGQRTGEFHIVGKLTSDPGLRALRGITIAPASIGFDRLASKGVELGKADIRFHMAGGILSINPTPIPANGGTLYALGKIDFNADPPAYIIDKTAGGTTLVKGLALNHDIAAGPLNFLPLVWGDKGGNLANVQGQANVQMTEAYLPLNSAAYKTKGTLSGTLSVSNVSTDIPFLQDAMKNLGPLMKITQPDLFSIRGGTIPDVAFALANGKVTYQNLRLGSAQASITFSGSVGLDTSLEMSVEVTAKQTSIPIPIGLKGTTSKPELSITGGGTPNPADLGKSLQKAAPQIFDQLMKKKK